ncbi:WS/DGAT/MGAT family O-acyltransferase [Hoyosella altamirensis]|uniref:Diacylglycerol O-acyltransferase n=1 Tax=Hoyosella altamirensis TaxID=616997 RepID=A0A839RHD1_9ACTN|nr:wax ester/triacylglycerol synthase family O-acyltransferase [Hoyosella altamirensis]MBB3035648.1 WS/DGAT/MGAT family acyltransferase [Hoyosella altamirensis]
MKLSNLDSAFYYLEDSTTPMHVGTLAIFRTPQEGLDYDSLLNLVEERIGLVPRYRRRVKEVARGLGRPVWVDDSDFDITYHVRRSALPRPGGDDQLHDLIARLISRPLDRTRPLWEMYLVEGLSEGRAALFIKSHEALVDGIENMEIGQVIFDRKPRPPELADDLWMPEREPSDARLLAGAVMDLVSRPREAADTLRLATKDVSTTVTKVAQGAGKLASMVWSAASNAPTSPLNVTISRNRRYAVAAVMLSDFRRIRARYGCTVNDVVLSVLTGALRNWLVSRGEPVSASTTVRALVPMAVYLEGAPEGPDSRKKLSSFMIDLPVGEANPIVRLSQVAHATEVHSTSGRSVDAGTLVQLSGFAPATLHALSARVASSFSQRGFNLIITNAPGPQSPLFSAGVQMTEMYPVPPLVKNQALSIGVTSYDGRIYFGFNADRAAMPDVDVFAAMLGESLDELREACS